MSSKSRTELEAMSHDELVEYILDLQTRVDDLEARLDASQAWRESLTAALFGETLSEATSEGGSLDDETLVELVENLRDQIASRVDTLHRERSKLARRVAALEDEVGVSTQDAVAIAEGGDGASGLSRLGLLVKHGPEAVSDNPSTKMRRAKILLENWTRWGTVRDDALGTERRLASKGHDLKTRLEDARHETLSWLQVYRAMDLINDWSDSTISLEDGAESEGKYVLVHRPERGESP
jgi:nucleotide-binding universal stress UspA family protein